MGQNLKNSYLPHRGELRPHIWGGEPWPTYLSNDPKLERFRDFATPNFTAPTIIPTVKADKVVKLKAKKKRTLGFLPELSENWRKPEGFFL